MNFYGHFMKMNYYDGNYEADTGLEFYINTLYHGYSHHLRNVNSSSQQIILRVHYFMIAKVE